MTQEPKGAWAMALSFVVALTLTALPMPEWAGMWRPAWVALVLIYWCMAAPARVGVATGWLVGLLLDVLSGSLLGQHALGLSIIAFVAHQWHQRIRVLPVLQQGLSVFALVFIYQVVLLWINGIQGMQVAGIAYWSSPVMSMVLWPWVFIVLRDIRRRYRVS